MPNLHWIRARIGRAFRYLLPCMALASGCADSNSKVSGTVDGRGDLELRMGEVRFRVADPSLAGRQLRIERLQEELIPSAVTSVYRFEPTGLRFEGEAEVCFEVPRPERSGIAWGEFMALEMLPTRLDGEYVCAAVEHFSIGAGTMGADELDGGSPFDGSLDASLDGSLDASLDAPPDGSLDAPLDGSLDAPDAAVDGGAARPHRCDPDFVFPASCAADADCDDACFCNGTATCEGGTCVADANIDCDDGLACTRDGCHEDVRRCRHLPSRDEAVPECTFANATCATATELPLPGFTGGNTELLLPSGRAVYRVTVPEVSDLLVQVYGGHYSITIRRWEDCEMAPALETVPYYLALTTYARLRNAAAGDYAIMVDSRESDLGFDLDVRLLPPTPPTSFGTCATATALTEAGGPYYGPGSLGPGARSTNYLRLELSEPSIVEFDARVGGPFLTSYTNPELAILRSCDTSESPIVREPFVGPNPLRWALPAGSYVVRVTPDSENTWWLLRPYVRPLRARPPGDSCATAIPVGATPVVLPLDDLEKYLPLPSCGYDGTTEGVDAAFYFDLTEPSDVAVRVEGIGVTTVATSCADISTELSCQRTHSFAPEAVSTYRGLPAGRYWVTTTSESPTTTVSVNATPAAPLPENDGCAGAIPLVDGSERNDTLVGFTDDVVGHTGTGRPDSFYRIDLSTRSLVTVEVDPIAVPSTASITVRESCFGMANLATGDGRPARTMIDLNPGLYFVIVEASTMTDFTIRTTVTPL